MNLVLVFCCFFLISCNSNLSRNNARNQIVAQFKLPATYTWTLQEYDSYCKTLISKGLFTEQKSEQNSSNNNNSSGGIFIRPVYIRLGFPYDITELGKKYLVQYDSEYNPTVILGDLIFDEITGISKIDQYNTEVHYTLKCSNITPFGEVLLSDNGSIQKVANFRKYDDGWRIE